MAPAIRPLTSLGAAATRVDWARTHAQVLRYAIYRTKSRDLAGEIAQQVLADAIDPDGAPWDPEREPDIMRHLIGRVNGAVAVARKKERLRRRKSVVAHVIDLLTRPVRTPAEESEMRQRTQDYRARWAALRASFDAEGDTLASQVLDQYEKGTIHAPDQARALGLEAPQVHDVRRRITRRARALAPQALDEETS